VIEDKKWPITTTELENLYKDVNICTLIKLQRCGWMGYLLVERMDGMSASGTDGWDVY
jgi:hypothetical protein